jgi:hypothetical protein
MWTTKISLSLILSVITNCIYAQDPIVLVNNGKSDYKIVLAKKATAFDLEAANLLQGYIKKVSGAKVIIIDDHQAKNATEILIGTTNRQVTKGLANPDAFQISSNTKTISLNGNGPKSSLYAVYFFLEKYLGCRKYAAEFEFVPSKKTILIPANLKLLEQPDFDYREIYYDDSKQQSYLDWHHLNRMDDLWGLWVHTFDKLVPASMYFKEHPAYFALVDGKRKESQLCLSNPEVFKILCQNLKAKMNDEPTLKYWSVSQNDDLGYCECNLCDAVDRKEGGPQGSILKFVNKVAKQFPDKIISTLAYTYSQKAPRTLKPAPNVQIMLCSIDCNRSQPIATDPSSASFRKDLKDWSKLTDRLFVWDYNVQFTNYISPFPNFDVLQPNLQFFKANKVKGVFLQGSGDTPAEFSELRGYLLAKLSWNTNADIKQITSDFLNGYYGMAAPFIQGYLDLLHANLQISGSSLAIYGNPVSVHRSYLSPEQIERYGILFDQAEASVSNQPILLQHVKTARLPIEYAVLQQSKFFGVEKHGIFAKNEAGRWQAKPVIKRKVKAFLEEAKIANISVLAEGGQNLAQYAADWEKIFLEGPKDHLGLNAKVIIVEPFSDEYQNKGAATLTDGSRGYLDYAYNWLGWYGKEMDVIIDLQREMEINQVSISFLEDQRHWAFLPVGVTYTFSSDGAYFTGAKTIAAPHPLYENYERGIQDYTLNLPSPQKARYIKVSAKNLTKLPSWRYYKHKKAWLFADEIMIR